MMRLLIVEDENTVARRLVRLLEEAGGSEIQSLDRCATLEEAREWLAGNEVDAVFLDLNLNGDDGFDLLVDLSSRPFHTVVVSGHAERALEAFEFGVLDFIPKPFGAERVAKTFERLRGAHRGHAASALAIRSPGRVDLVPIAEIDYVRASGSFSELVLLDGSTRLHQKSLERLQSLLPAVFERVHRSYIVRVDGIVRLRVQKGSRYSAELRSGVEVPVGRTKVEGLRKRLEPGGGTDA